MSTTLSQTTFNTVLSSLKRHFRFDPKHIAKYINEHKSSAVSPGVKWADLPDPLGEGAGFWKEVYDHIVHIWTVVIPEKSEQYISRPYNVGIRARNEATVERDVFEYDLEDDRSRIILYTSAMSMVLCFVPDKTSLYRDIKDRISKILDLPPFLFPPTDGGVVYKKWSDMDNVVANLGDDWNEKHGDEQLSWDGKNWEQWVGQILGDAWNPAMVVLDGLTALPSGSWLTTIAGSIAMWHLATQARKEGISELPGIWERQPEDEKVKFLLGLQYAIDPDNPRLQGLKLSIDDARKMRKLEPMKALTLESNYKEQQSVSWYNAYHGLTINGESLLSAFEQVEPEDYVSPGTLVKRLVLDDSR